MNNGGSGGVTIEDGSKATGGDGGTGNKNGGSGGNGVTNADGSVGDITIDGNAQGGSGGTGSGEGGTGGKGGSGVTSEGSASGEIIINGGSAGGEGGKGGSVVPPATDEFGNVVVEEDGPSGTFNGNGGVGGSGVENSGGSGSITIAPDAAILGGNGGGATGNGTGGGTGGGFTGDIKVAISYTMTGLKASAGSPTNITVSVSGTGAAATEDFKAKLETISAKLFDLPEAIIIKVTHQLTGAVTTLDKSQYTYDPATGDIEVKKELVTGKISITAEAKRKESPVKVSTEDELNLAIKGGYTDIVLDGSITISKETIIPEGTKVTIDDNKTLTVGNGGTLINGGNIGGNNITVDNGGTLQNDGKIDIGGTLTNNGNISNSTGGSITAGGNITNNSGGVITNDGKIESSGGKIENDGKINQVDGAPEIKVDADSSGGTIETVWKVTFNVRGIGKAPQTLMNVKNLPNPLPTVEAQPNNTFGGWFLDDACTKAAVPGAAIEGNTIIYAKWANMGSGGGDSTVPDKDAPVIVDGKEENIGKVEQKDDTTTVIPDQGKLEGKIEEAKPGSSVVVPINSTTSTAAAQFVVKNVEDMSAKDMTLSVKVGDISYELPTTAVNTSELMKALGASDSADVPFTVTVSNTDAAKVSELKNTAAQGGFEVVGKPMDFNITASYGGKSVIVDRLGGMAARVFEISEADANRITTAVVYEPNGTVRHVPTYVFRENGKCYAKVNSMTNSTYVLIYNELKFSDAVGKWYEAAVDEMGSRKVINGVGGGLFAGERSITRAEFAVMITRALGLPANGSSSFADVPANEWFAGGVGTAAEYGIVGGRTSSSFDPQAAITRQEAMAMMARAAKLIGYKATPDGLTGFADTDKIDEWAKADVAFNVGGGLIQGSDGKLRPKENISRAETATVIRRLLRMTNLIEER